MEITGTTHIIALLGHPVSHTLSPVIHNAAFRAVGLNCCYVPFDVRPGDLSQGVRALRAFQVKGANVTVPHKERILSCLDRLSPEAQMIGAVNTLERRGRSLIGHNTDGKGFVAAFKEEAGVPIKEARFLVLGAGGAARAITVQLAMEKAKAIFIANRTVQKGRALARRLTRLFPHGEMQAVSLNRRDLSSLLREVDVVINATSVGLHPGDPVLLPSDLLRAGLVVYDLIYHRAETPLMAAARKGGSKSLNGLGMLLHQGALSFEIWTGKQAPLTVMRAAVQEFLKKSAFYDKFSTD